MKAHNLRLERGGRALLDDVSLTVAAGEVLAVLGPNGAGKSSLRKALSGEWQPSRGTVTLNDKPLTQWPLADLARMRAVLPQDSTLNFPFTVLEVALLGRTPHLRGRERPHDLTVARAALEAAEASHLATRLYPTLSGGERQRVQLARVLAQVWDAPQDGAARYLLLDEPTSNLDLAHQHQTLAIARRFAAQGVGVFIILHDLNLAAQYADRLLLLKAGRVVVTGSPVEVLQAELLREVFQLPVIVTHHPQLIAPLVLPLPLV